MQLVNMEEKIHLVTKKFDQYYNVIVWPDEDSRNAGESDIYGSRLELDEALNHARTLIADGDVVSAEIRCGFGPNPGATVFYIGPDENEEKTVEEWLV